MAGHVHLICTVQDHDWGAKYFYLAGCEIFTVKEKPFFSLVRGSMVRGNLHHKMSHNIENYLQ